MLLPVLSSACYTDPYWFDLERQKIFGSLWIFIGLKQQLQQENDFITRTVGGVPVLVQNINGELRAFRNTCTHKGMPIQTQLYGNRKLLCPYHGWSFHGDGRLRGIPNEHIYNICNRSELNLKQLGIETVGNFIFINISEKPFPIENQLSEQLRSCLEIVSKHFDSRVSYTTFTGRYNWKLNFENILDWNHVPFVHSKTFSPIVNYAAALPKNKESTKTVDEGTQETPTSPFRDIDFRTPIHRRDEVLLHDINWISRVSLEYHGRWYTKFLENIFDKGHLFGCHIFPNFNFGSLHGETFYLQQYDPLAPDLTNFHSWVFTSKIKEELPPQPHLLWGIHHAEKRVIDEDRVLLEAMQASLLNAGTMGVLGDYEHRQHTMARWYMQNLAGKEAMK